MAERKSKELRQMDSRFPTVYTPMLSIKNNDPLSPLVAVKDASVLELYEA